MVKNKYRPYWCYHYSNIKYKEVYVKIYQKRSSPSNPGLVKYCLLIFTLASYIYACTQSQKEGAEIIRELYGTIGG
jgi:hypothetical protein